MEFDLFDLATINKNDNIKIICNTLREDLICDNICTKLITKYNVSRETRKCFRYGCDGRLVYNVHENISDIIFVLDCVLEYYHNIYSAFMSDTDYHNYLFCYASSDGTLIDTPITIICGEGSRILIKNIYDKYIDKETYLLEHVFGLFKKHDIIVISNNGKLLTYYELDNPLTWVFNYYDNNLNYQYISNMINQIVKGTLYYSANMTLHKYLLSRADVLKTCHHSLIILSNHMPTDTRNIILNLMIMLCKKTNRRKDIAQMCLLDINDIQSRNFWNLHLQLIDND